MNQDQSRFVSEELKRIVDGYGSLNRASGRGVALPGGTEGEVTNSLTSFFHRDHRAPTQFVTGPGQDC